MRFPQGALVILVLVHPFAISLENCGFPRPLLVVVLDEAARERCSLMLPPRWKLPRPLHCQCTLPTILTNHAASFTVTCRCLSQIFVFVWVVLEVSTILRRLRRLCVFAGAGVEVSHIESCHTDVEGVVSALQVERPVDKPGTTTSTLFSVLQCIFLPVFNKMCLLTTRGIPVIFAELSKHAAELNWWHPRGAVPS